MMYNWLQLHSEYCQQQTFEYVASLAYLDQYNPALQLEVSPPDSLVSCSPTAAAGSGHTNAQIAALPSTPSAPWPNSFPRQLESQLDQPSSIVYARSHPISEMWQAAGPQWCTGAQVCFTLLHTPALAAPTFGNVRALAPLQQATGRPAQAGAEVAGVAVQLAETLTWFPESQMPPCTVDTYIVPHVQGFGQQLISKCCTGTGPPPGSASTGVAGAGPEVASAGVVRAGAPSLPPACSKTGLKGQIQLLTAVCVQASCCQKCNTYQSRCPSSKQLHTSPYNFMSTQPVVMHIPHQIQELTSQPTPAQF